MKNNKVIFVTFANDKCKSGQRGLVASAKQTNTFITNYNTWIYEDYILTDFYKEHLNITSEKRGVGYWVWKPYLILEAMKQCKDGDVVIYHDAGRPVYNWKLTKSIKPLVDYVIKSHRGLGVIWGPFNHGEYCKRDCLIKMGCDTPQYRHHRQVSATWSIWEKNTFTLEILNEWYRWNIHSSRIVTDDKSKEAEYDNFDSHRHDQAILTNILLKYVFENKYKPFFAKRGIYEKNINHFVHKPFIFISIPKNASQSIHSALGIKLHDKSDQNEMAICDNHARGVLLKERYKDYNKRFKFCVVRNPYERVKSWYSYHKDVLKLRPYIDVEFNNWVLSGCPHHWKIQNETNYEKNKELSPLNQWQFIYDEKMNLLVDMICKFENLENDFKKVCEKIEISPIELTKRNNSKKGNLEYTVEAKAKVVELFKKDFDLFNYSL